MVIKERDFLTLFNAVYSRRHLFKIGSVLDLELFVKGCYVANIVYKMNDPALNRFFWFTNYLNKYFKINRNSESWSHLLMYWENGDSKAAFRTFDLLFDEFWKLSVDVERGGIENSFLYKLFDASQNFADAMRVVKKEHNQIGIKSIEDFDIFYLGYYVYGDFDKGIAHFIDLKDNTFINLHAMEDNLILGKILETYTVEPSRSYSSIISYLAPSPDQGIDVFFKLMDSIEK